MASNKKIILPDFIEASIAMMYPIASEEKLEEVRTQWVEQLALKEKRIAETNGAVLKPDLARQIGYMITPVSTEELPSGTQTVWNKDNLTGLADGNFTRFYTPNLNQGAAVFGKSFPFAGGDVYLTTKLGPNYASGSGNRLIVWGSKTGANSTWVPIGNVAVTSTATNGAQQYVGYTSINYAYVTVGTNTMMGGSVTFNDVMADCVYSII